jgi:hypothetical protein
VAPKGAGWLVKRRSGSLGGKVAPSREGGSMVVHVQCSSSDFESKPSPAKGYF